MRCSRAAAALYASALLALAGAAQAATTVSGSIGADTRWRAQDGPFEVAADIEIVSGATLTIDAGVTIYMAPNTNLVVAQGALRALGTQQSPVVITSTRDRGADTPAPGDWGRLDLLDGTLDAATILEHTEIRYGSGVVIRAAAPTFNFVTLAGNAGPAMAIDLASSPGGHGNRAIGNGLNGILVPAGDILGSVSWTLAGIPFLIQGGTLGVGAAPAITSVEPARIEQGETIEALVRGTRLAGAESVSFGSPAVTAVVRSGATDTQIPVTVSAAPNAALGAVEVSMQVAAGKATLPAALTVVVPLPPIVATAIAPASIRRGHTASFTVNGSALLGAQVSPSDAQLSIANVATTATQATFALSASATAALGTAVLSLTNPGVSKGVASIGVLVRKALPRIVITPALLAVPPDGSARQFRIRLSDSDDEDHSVTVTVSDASVAALSPLTFTIPAGQTEQTLTLRGLKQGFATLTVSSPGLATVNADVVATPEYNSINVSYAAIVGVEKPVAPTTATTKIEALVSPALGVATGRYLTRIEPGSLRVASGPAALVIRGTGLEGVTGVSIVPATGLTLGAHAVAADGTTVSIPVTVAPDAPTILRQVVLSGTHAPYAVLRAEADRLLIVLAPPVVESIEPVFAAPGTLTTLVVRGRNLQAAELVSAVPAAGISLGFWPQVSADGTVLTTQLGVAAGAPAGNRTITVTTPGGASTAAASSANTLRIVSAVQGVFTPIASANVGIEKATSTTPSTSPVALTSSALGVNVGAVLKDRSPATGTIGETVQLTLSGSGLQGVTTVALVPATGVTVGAPAVAADGRTITVALQVAAGAPQTLRSIEARAGAQLVPFATPETALFRITPPLPRLESVSPVLAQIGATTPLTLRGVNFQNASEVRIQPKNGVSVSTPPTLISSTELAVNVTVAAGTAPGARTVVVVTPAGETDAAATAANTLTLATTLSPLFTPLTARDVGVEKQVTTLTSANTIEPLVAPAVGVAVGPVVLSVEAPTLRPYGAGEIVLRGVGLGQVTGVSIVPDADMTSGPAFQVNAEGTELRVSFTVGGNPNDGAREIVVQTAAGRLPFATASSAALTLLAGTQYFFTSSTVGVARDPVTQPGTSTAGLTSAAIGVAVGTSVTGMQVGALYPGASATLTLTGRTLQNVTGITFRGPAGLSAGTLQVNAEGTQLTVPLTVAAATLAGVRGIVLTAAGGEVAFANPLLTQISVASGVPAIDSIEPIVWQQGQAFTLTLRGRDLGLASGLVVAPAEGITVDSAISVSADGTALTVRIGVAADAPPTDEGFVQAVTPAGSTPAARSAANGFRIVH